MYSSLHWTLLFFSFLVSQRLQACSKSFVKLTSNRKIAVIIVLVTKKDPAFLSGNSLREDQTEILAL